MADVHRLPVPVTDSWDWQLRGSCRDVSSELFFHPDRERGPARSAREARAKNVCRRCPVLARCRAHALAVREPHGIWGGMTVDERNAQIRLEAALTSLGQPDDPDTGQNRSGARQPVMIDVDFTRAGQHRRPPGPAPDPWPAA